MARPLWLIAASALLTGVAVDIYRPASSAAVADIIDPADRPRAFAIIYWAVNLGVSVSGVLGGLLAVHGWWILFALDAATSVVFALLIARGVPESLARARAVRVRAATARSCATGWPSPWPRPPWSPVWSTCRPTSRCPWP